MWSEDAAVMDTKPQRELSAVCLFSAERTNSSITGQLVVYWESQCGNALSEAFPGAKALVLTY